MAHRVDRLKVVLCVDLFLRPLEALCLSLGRLVVHLVGWQWDKALSTLLALAQVAVALKDAEPDLTPCCAVPSGVAALLAPGHSQPHPIAPSPAHHQVPRSAIRCAGNTNTEAARYLVVGAFDAGHFSQPCIHRPKP